MLGQTPLVLIVLPVLFQLIFGTIAILKPSPLKFKTVFIVNIILEVILSITAFYIASHNFSRYIEQNPNSNRCAMAFVGLGTLVVLSALILFAIISIQYLIKKTRDKSKENV